MVSGRVYQPDRSSGNRRSIRLVCHSFYYSGFAENFVGNGFDKETGRRYQKMREERLLRLRAHHGMCLAFLREKGIVTDLQRIWKTFWQAWSRIQSCKL